MVVGKLSKKKHYSRYQLQHTCIWLIDNDTLVDLALIRQKGHDARSPRAQQKFSVTVGVKPVVCAVHSREL